MQNFAFQPVRHESGIFRLMHQGLSPPWCIRPHGISVTCNMKSSLAIKFPTPYEWWSNAPPLGRLSLLNSLPPRQEKASNARGMPGGLGGGCLSFDLTGTLACSCKQMLASCLNFLPIAQEETRKAWVGCHIRKNMSNSPVFLIFLALAARVDVVCVCFLYNISITCTH